MKPVLITGATGFIGWHVARQLVERGERVRCLVRASSRLRELEAETVCGDLRDPSSLQHAVAGCGTVYHVAADYRLWSKNPQDLYDSNAGGTRNILQAARQAGVERFVYTSTVGCIGIPDGGIGDESMPVTIQQMSGHYKRSKFQAERTALEFARDGFPVVIVNPTAPVGDHDFKPTPTGKIIVDFLKRQMPAYVDTGLNLVDVRDTAKGHLLAAERGKPGERYILGCRNMTLREILEGLGQISGIPAPQVRIPYAVAYAAGVCSTGWASLTGSEPRVPLEGVRMARKKMFVSSEKAKRDLGFEPAPVEGALQRAVDWFRANGYC
ncbi:MAG: NAD-dependent epimerase/dehydratase family protein [Candidatus Solibacter usitatus]|nr:NAD-dependent epimerase/dehydratase family protein [Candidatus Solibacter usitatus]